MEDEPPSLILRLKKLIFSDDVEEQINVQNYNVVEILVKDGKVERKIILNRKTLTGVLDGIIYFVSREGDREKFLKRTSKLLERAGNVVLVVGKDKKVVNSLTALSIVASF